MYIFAVLLGTSEYSTARNIRLKPGTTKDYWTGYSGGKLRSCLKLRNFQNPFEMYGRITK